MAKVIKPKPATKVNKAKPKSKGKKPKGQTRKVPTLTQKLAKASKVVKLDNLKWKKVDIPANFDDFLGGYGLEEIDGVDVEMVDGVPVFVMAEGRADQEEQSEEEDDDFGGFEDEEEIIEKKPKKSKKNNKDLSEVDRFELLDETAETSKPTEAKKSAPKPVEPEKPQGELLQNTFTNKTILPDDSISLPQWESIVKLSPYTINALSKMRFGKPTPIQRDAIPLAISGKDVIGKATTGSGKTLAFGIPILENYISREESEGPSGIIFAPTRELAHQVVEHLNLLAKFSPLAQHGVVSITGGLSIQKQERLLVHNPAIIVATPGRFLELIEKDGELARKLAKTDTIVLDEADRLLQDGHFDEFEKIMEILVKNRVGPKWQTLVFSATFLKDLFGKLEKNTRKGNFNEGAFEDGEILKLLDSKLKFKSKPVLIDVNPSEIVSGLVTEALVECGPMERDLYLYYFLLMYPGTTLVFANSIDTVKRLVPMLLELNIPAFSIHSGMMQKQRLRALERFKENKANNPSVVLIASDVAARGLDIPDIDHVVHYHLPRTADVYIHRSGRTARAGKEGVSIMFCSPQEASGPLRKLRGIVATSAQNTKMNMHTDVKLLPIEMTILNQLKPRVTALSKLGDALVSGSASRKQDLWVKQAAEDLGMSDDEFEDMDRFEDDVIKKQRKRTEAKLMTKIEQKQLRFELKDMLAVPLRKNGRRSYLTGADNLAHQIVTGKTHKDILGHQSVNALDLLRKKKEPEVVEIKTVEKVVNESGKMSRKEKRDLKGRVGKPKVEKPVKPVKKSGKKSNKK